MTENLLQYIWQFQYFNKSGLVTSDLQPLQIIFPGNINVNQGPDFLNASIKVGHTTWAGNIELHINATDWNAHNHSNDSNYNNVILHVVWNIDAELNLPFATLQLQPLVSSILLKKYEGMNASRQFIPCENQLRTVDELTVISWKEKLLVERLQNKTNYIEKLLKEQQNNWEEVLWWMLARNFGATVNSDSFELIARSLPLQVLSKHRNQLVQIEALLFGQACLLETTFTEKYPVMLQKEYQFLQQKYGLKKIHGAVYFLRMRPANFPTIRLAQLAVLLQKGGQLLSRIRESTDHKDLEQFFKISANDYWHYHYLLDQPTSFKTKTLGKQMIQNIMINTVIPVLFANGRIQQNNVLKEKALRWLSEMPAEKNNICDAFIEIGFPIKSAFESQACIQLKNEYCNNKYCLHCAIGNKIIRPG